MPCFNSYHICNSLALAFPKTMTTLQSNSSSLAWEERYKQNEEEKEWAHFMYDAWSAAGGANVTKIVIMTTLFSMYRASVLPPKSDAPTFRWRRAPAYGGTTPIDESCLCEPISALSPTRYSCMSWTSLREIGERLPSNTAALEESSWRKEAEGDRVWATEKAVGCN